MLTSTEIKHVLDLLSQEVVVSPNKDFNFTISTRRFGYAPDSFTSNLQAKLSILLQVASMREAEDEH